LHGLVFRPLLILLTLTALVIASLQVAGRLLFWVLDDLEVAANQALWGLGVRIEGLEGDWHYLNPVVRIARIELPAGYVGGVDVEVDLLESLWHGSLITHRFTLAEGDIGLEHAEAGWRFVGGLGRLDFDLTDLIYQSDSIVIDSRLRFFSDAGEGQLDLHYQALNRSGFHRHRLQLHNPDQACVSDCDLQLAFDGLEAVVLVRQSRQTFRAEGEGFELPPALTRMGAIRFDALSAHWRAEAQAEGGSLMLRADGLELTPGQPLAANLVLNTRGSPQGQIAQLETLEFGAGDESLSLPTVWLELSDGVVRWWTPKLDLGTTLGFLGRVLPPGSAGSRWLGGLQVQAQALNLRGYFDRASNDLGYAATLRQVNLESFGGAPYMRGGGGELVGFQAGMQIQLNARDMDTHWRAQFADNWLMHSAQGILQAWFGPGYFAMRGLGMRLSVADSNASGGFALNRVIGQPQEDRLTLIVNVDEATVPSVKRFVPMNLPTGLVEWVKVGPQDGILRDISFAYHGHIFVQPFQLARRAELAAQISAGHFQYHPDWPDLLNVDGFVEVSGRDVRLQVRHAVSEGGASLDGSRLLLADNAAYADITLSTETTVEDTLSFVRRTPLQQYLTFITPDWTGEGPISLDGTLHIPLRLPASHIGETSFADEFAAQLDLGMSSASLQLPAYRIELDRLNGLVTYQYPNDVRANGVRGYLFDKPATFSAYSDEDTVVFDIAGQAAYGDVLDMLELSDPGIMHGGFDFLANVHIERGDEVSRIEVVSDLTGLALDLPGEFAKQPEDEVATSVNVRFLDDYQALSFGHGSARGWLHVDETLLRGAIGFDEPAPLLNSNAEELLLSGRLRGFALDDVIPDAETPGSLPLPVRLENLQTDYVALNTLRFTDVTINGRVAPDDLSLIFTSDSVQGEVSYLSDEPMQIHLTHLILPAGDESAGDPLDPALIGEVPRADVTVDQFTVGEADYGSWAFSLEPVDQVLHLNDLEAQLRGVAISSAEGSYWDGVSNESHFKGTLRAGDLKEVLPLWDIAPSLTTKSAELSGDLSWVGSPANVDVDRLVGPAKLRTGEGRFLEVDSGGQGAFKVFSLVNFSTVLKRLNFDFSDVRGEGITFEEIRAATFFDKGMVTFTPGPMEIIGSGSEFKIAGQVNLIEGSMDNEMIVTLPVTRSLPWYAAYIALANPLTAIGVIVGERVLRKPIEQFSSAKYTITGPIENPELHFVNVWDRSVDKPAAEPDETSDDLPVGTDTADGHEPEKDS